MNDLPQDLFDLAREALKTQSASYDEYLSLIDAQRLLLEFELSYAKAVSDFGRSLAEIGLIVGGISPPAGGPGARSPRKDDE